MVPSSRRSTYAWALALLAVQLLLFLFMAEWRLIDGDEGLYLSASREMLKGRAAFGDFFWPQFPVMPWVYGMWTSVVGTGWFRARLLSAILAAGTGTILFVAASRQPLNRRWGAAAVAIFLACGLTFAWQPLVKTYALTTFLLTAAWALQPSAEATATPSRTRTLLSGLLLGAAIATRLLVVPTLPLFLVAVARQGKGQRERLACLFQFGTGVLLGLAPLLPHLLRFPDQFAYMTLIAHGDRNSTGRVFGDVLQKVGVATQLLGVTPLAFPHMRTAFQWSESMQTAALALPLAISTGGCIRQRRWPSLAFWIVLGMTAASLVPTPTYIQYWTILVPFLAFLAVQCGRQAWLRRVPRWGVILWSALFLFAAPFEAWRNVVSGVQVPVLLPQESRGDWRVSTMRLLAQEVDRWVKPGEQVLALWPGNVVASHASIVPGFENQNTFGIGSHRTRQERQKYHLTLFEDFLAEVASHRHRLVIVGNFWNKTDAIDFLTSLGYRRIRTFAGSDIELWWADGTTAIKA